MDSSCSGHSRAKIYVDAQMSDYILLQGVTPSELLEKVSQYGEPFGYQEERDGLIVHDLTPAVGQEATQSSYGRAEFLPHTDAAFLPLEERPAKLALLGLNNDAQSATLIYRLTDVLSHLDETTIGKLEQPLFEQIPPLTFQNKLGSEPRKGHRILSRDENGQFVVAYSAQGTRGGEAPEVLEAFEAALRKTTPIRFVIQPEELLIFDNLHCLHGREVIVGPRHLQRVYLR